MKLSVFLLTVFVVCLYITLRYHHHQGLLTLPTSSNQMLESLLSSENVTQDTSISSVYNLYTFLIQASVTLSNDEKELYEEYVSKHFT